MSILTVQIQSRFRISRNRGFCCIVFFSYWNLDPRNSDEENQRSIYHAFFNGCDQIMKSHIAISWCVMQLFTGLTKLRFPMAYLPRSFCRFDGYRRPSSTIICTNPKLKHTLIFLHENSSSSFASSFAINDNISNNLPLCHWWQYSSSCLFPPPLTSMARSGQYHAPPEIVLHLHNDPFHMTKAPP